ncbi:MAG TPA: lamin tail domain-containing protein [Candidatus Paceibacterota bacterium]
MISRGIAIILVGLSGITAFAATDVITKITVTTPTQHIAKNAVSTALTVQTQNAVGEAEKVSETTDMSVISSSSSGEFSSNASTWKSVTTLVMSTNSANRTVYYKDSADGAHTLTFTAKGRTSGKEWTTTQIITVGTISDQGSQTATSTSDIAGETPTDVGSDSKNTSPISTHGSGQELSDMVAKDVLLKVSAGRKRMGHTGSPVFFDADWSFTGGRDGIRFVWSFGDGTSGDGERIFHAYAFPGEYVAIVNSYAGNYRAVSRTTVTIVDSRVSVTNSTDELIELYNAAEQEINLSGWTLRQGNRTYAIPIDTILLPKVYMRIARMITRLPNEGALSLDNPSSRPVMTFGVPQTDGRFTAVRETEPELEAIKQRLALIMADPPLIRELATSDNTRELAKAEEQDAKDVTRPTIINNVANVVFASASTTERAAVIGVSRPSSRFGNLSIVKWIRGLWGKY